MEKWAAGAGVGAEEGEESGEQKRRQVREVTSTSIPFGASLARLGFHTPSALCNHLLAVRDAKPLLLALARFVSTCILTAEEVRQYARLTNPNHQPGRTPTAEGEQLINQTDVPQTRSLDLLSLDQANKIAADAQLHYLPNETQLLPTRHTAPDHHPTDPQHGPAAAHTPSELATAHANRIDCVTQQADFLLQFLDDDDEYDDAAAAS